MLKELLIKLGLTAEQYKEAKPEIDKLVVPKYRFDDVNTELKTVKEQVAERDAQIKDLKKFEGTAAELQEKITSLENDNKEKGEEYSKKLLLEQKKNAISLALLSDKSKPFDVEMVTGLIDIDKVEIDENSKIKSGFSEQFELLKKEKSFLFNTEEVDADKPLGIRVKGNEPKESDQKPKTKDADISIGKSLAERKLSMMGIRPEEVKE